MEEREPPRGAERGCTRPRLVSHRSREHNVKQAGWRPPSRIRPRCLACGSTVAIAASRAGTVSGIGSKWKLARTSLPIRADGKGRDDAEHLGNALFPRGRRATVAAHCAAPVTLGCGHAPFEWAQPQYHLSIVL
jgi:hypothetical protein